VIRDVKVVRDRATAFAPASVGNVGVGFDVMGHALQCAGDTVTVERGEGLDVRVVEVTGLVTDLPMAMEENTASAAAAVMATQLGLGGGFRLRLHKGIPLGSGMGGSAASAVGAVVAMNLLLDKPLPPEELYPFALAGEKVASGGAHGDNVAPCLVGGLVVVGPHRVPDSFLRVPVPEELRCVLVHPELRIDTRESRAALPVEVPMATVIAQSANLAAFICGCISGDLDLVRQSLWDEMIEPHRCGSIPGFDAVQLAAIDSGALGCTISGAGPSMFAWFADDEAAEDGRGAMVEAFQEAGLEAEGWLSPVAGEGAREVHDD